MEHELKLTAPAANRAYFGPRAAMICNKGARRLLELPRGNSTIYAVVSDEDTGPDCFELSDNGKTWVFTAIRLADHLSIELDVDFARWLRPHIKAGRKYLRIEYDFES